MTRDEARTKPVVFLAFANEQEGRRYLRDLPEESRQLQSILQEAEDRELCELVVRTNATLDVIDEVFRRYGSRVAIFHFAGHANADRLLLESASSAAAAHAEGLAGFLGGQGGVKLVFLNGCSTRPQVAELLRKGIDVVLATARPIGDAAARAFAVDFYKQLVAGRTFRDAFEQARDLAKIQRGSSPGAFLRDVGAFGPEDVADQRGFPWDFQVRPGAERTERTSLADLAGDPLFGLPTLPAGGYLPPKPYPEPLQRFTAREAYVFFGRGRAIRELYDLVTSTASRPVILYSGPTGVGKSSVLDAGLRPRLAASHRVVYLRRNADLGLLETLLHGLSPDPKNLAVDLGVAWCEAEAASKRPLAVVLDQAEEAFTRPLAVAPPSGTEEAVALRRSWIDPPRELAELVTAVRQLFVETSPAPRGRLILAFRKEWLHEFERPHDEAGLGYERMLLGPLDREGIVDAIEGPTRNPDLQRHYRLTVEPGLAQTIAAYLEADSRSALAPALQVLLTKLWQRAGGPGGTFTRDLYDRLYDEGILLQDVLNNGLKALKQWNPEVVESGLALDMLAFHTTDQATAETRSITDLKDRYTHRSDVLDGMLGRCKEQYLLIEADAGTDPAFPVPATRLAHDTLAPLVQAAFRRSQAPGQRAFRLLENRAPEWVNADGSPREGAVLDLIDVMTVERGLAGMRGLDKHEDRLLAASRLAEERRNAQEAERQRQLRVALQREKLAGAVAESRRLAALSDLERPKRLDLAMLLAVEAANAGDTLEAHGSLQRTLDAHPKVVRFLHVPEGEVRTVAFGPEGRIAAGYGRGKGGVILFDARGERLQTAPLLVTEGGVTSMAFGPDGIIAAGYVGSGVGVILFDASAGRLRTEHLEVSKGHLTSVAFGPDGTIAAGYFVRDGGSVLLLHARGERLPTKILQVQEGRVRSVAFGPEGTIAAGYVTRGRGGGVLLFNRQGEQLITSKREVHEGGVRSVAFGPDGTIAAGYRSRGRGGVVLFDSQGGRLRASPQEVHEGGVESLAFEPDGTIAAGYLSPGKGGVVFFGKWDEPLRTIPLDVTEGQVTSVAFGPEGMIIAGFRRDDSGGVLLVDPRHEGLRSIPLVEPGGHVSSLAAGPDGMFAAGNDVEEAGDNLEGGEVLLFDTQGQRLQSLRLLVAETEVMSVTFGPGGVIAAGYVVRDDGGGVVLLDSHGERIRAASLEVKEGGVTSVAFGPDGSLAAGYIDSRSHGGGIVLFDPGGERLRPTPLVVEEGGVRTLVFGLDGAIAAGYLDDRDQVGGVVFFDARGQRLRSLPLLVPEGYLTSMAFGPKGTIAVGCRAPRNSVVLFDARGQRLWTATLPFKQDHVTSVTFGPGGTIAAGCGNVVVLFDPGGERLRLAPLVVEEGWLTSVAFSPEGMIAASYEGNNESGVVLFDVDPASWRRKAGQVANRNSTRDDWTNPFPETTYRRTIRSLPWPHDLPEAERIQAESFEMEHPEGSDAS